MLASTSSQQREQKSRKLKQGTLNGCQMESRKNIRRTTKAWKSSATGQDKGALRYHAKVY